MAFLDRKGTDIKFCNFRTTPLTKKTALGKGYLKSIMWPVFEC